MNALRHIALLSGLFIAGCNSNDTPKEIAFIFVEATAATGASMRKQVQLPVSGLTLNLSTRPIVIPEEILGTQAIMSGEPDLRQEFLLVQIDRKAAVEVMKYTKDSIGRRFILVINDIAVGIMPIEQQITDGNLMFHVEKKGLSNSEAVIDISKNLNISVLKLRKLKKSESK